MPRRHLQPPRADVRPSVNPHAAGLDIGSEEIGACVPEDRDDQPVRSFGTFTPDLFGLAEWLVSWCLVSIFRGPDPVSMNQTGPDRPMAIPDSG